jgi:DHA1 family bicyclomycin/chloramphenicol resistance-like MFS transporter
MTIEAGEGPERAVWLDRTTPPHLLTLVLLTGVPALNMNMMLPSLPSLAGHYGADYGIVALAISGYLALTAVLQLVFGPLSDRYGRRPVVLGCFVVFLAATLGAMAATTVWAFLACRMLQAPVSSGLALSRAIVRDMVPPERAASMIGYVTMGMALIPMVVPVLGGVLDELFGWQSVFAFTFVFGLAVTALLWADLGETNRDPSPSMRAQMRSYPELLRSARFWGYAATAALASGTFFAFIGGGPWVATQILGLTPSTFGFYFGFISAGYVVGNFFSGRYAMRVGINLMMLAGGLVGTAGVVLALVLFAAGLVGPLSFFGAILFVGVGNGLLLPSANAGIVSVEPHLAGSASGLGSAMLVGGGAALSVLGGGLLGPGTGAWPLLFVMLATSALGLATTLLVMRADGSGA